MFVVPCKFLEEAPIVFECVEAIQQYMPEEQILVMDSCSNTTEYLSVLYKTGCHIAKGNKNYETGAYWFAYENFPDENFFYLIHDSLIIQEDLSRYKHFDVSPIVTQLNWTHTAEIHRSWAKEIIKLTDYKYLKDGFRMFSGSMSCIRRSVLDKLRAKNFHKILPEDKRQSETMERLWGMVLAQEGYSPEELEILQVFGKDFRKNKVKWQNLPVKKVLLGRQ